MCEKFEKKTICRGLKVSISVSGFLKVSKLGKRQTAKSMLKGRVFMSNIIVIDMQNIFTYGKGYYSASSFESN